MIRPALAPTARRWCQPARVHSGLRGLAYALRLILLARCATPPSARGAYTSFPRLTQEAPRAKAGLGCLRRELLHVTGVKFAAPPVTQVLCYRIAAPLRRRKGEPAVRSLCPGGAITVMPKRPDRLPPGLTRHLPSQYSARRCAGWRYSPDHRGAAAGGVTSLSGISTALNARGVPTSSGRGQWYAMQFDRSG
jgi:hypothetical protein